MNQRKRKHAHGTAYAVPTVRLIELESEAPLLAGSVDELEGTTDPTNPPTGGGITLEDFQDGGSITIP